MFFAAAISKAIAAVQRAAAAIVAIWLGLEIASRMDGVFEIGAWELSLVKLRRNTIQAKLLNASIVDISQVGNA
jgi:hypothetical protein